MLFNDDPEGYETSRLFTTTTRTPTGIRAPTEADRSAQMVQCGRWLEDGAVPYVVSSRHDNMHSRGPNMIRGHVDELVEQHTRR